MDHNGEGRPEVPHDLGIHDKAPQTRASRYPQFYAGFKDLSPQLRGEFLCTQNLG